MQKTLLLNTARLTASWSVSPFGKTTLCLSPDRAYQPHSQRPYSRWGYSPIASVKGERNNDDAAQLASDVHANSPHDQATGYLMVPAMFPSFASSFIMNGKITPAPSFDKALKYSIPNAVSIHPHHRIGIIEGLYVFLAIRPWSDGGLLLDDRWLIQLDQEKARRPTRINQAGQGHERGELESR